MRKCLACGKDQLSEGNIVSGAPSIWVYGTSVEFNPHNGRGKIFISGTACLNCGHIEMTVDPKELRQSIRK